MEDGVSIVSGAYLDHLGRDICEVCGKVAYLSEGEAKAGGARRGLEVYKSDDCRFWHLTSPTEPVRW